MRTGRRFGKFVLKPLRKVICTAKGEDVRTVNVEYLLQKRLRIPIFQRRYCWYKEQWNTLLGDVCLVANGSKEKHALGRITCVLDNSGDGRLLVVDGQQRNTTCSLLLAAVRDVAATRHSEECLKLVSKLESLLFPGGLEEWMSARQPGTPLEEGAELGAAALVPTYCDRASYFAATLPRRASVPSVPDSGSWMRPMEAKLFFSDRLVGESDKHLVAVAEAVLYKLEWLLFPISLGEGDARTV